MSITTEYLVRFNGVESKEFVTTCTTKDRAKLLSMTYSICRYDDNDTWVYFYRGKQVDVQILKCLHWAA